MTATLTISIDLELAWGNWDDLSDYHLQQIAANERPIVARLVERLDHHDIAATFAIVAALLDPGAASQRPGPQSAWYAPDMLDMIRSARVVHDIGSQGGRHLYFDRIATAEASADLAYARALHDAAGLPFRSFVFPRNRIGHLGALRSPGLAVFRAPESAWHQRLRDKNVTAGRIANLVDKALPLAPPAVRPRSMGGLIALPASMLLLGRRGLRRAVPHQILLRKLRAGLDRAERDGGVFHLWFHPSNFWHDRERQFGLLEALLDDAAGRIRAGRLVNRTMAQFAADGGAGLPSTAPLL